MRTPAFNKAAYKVAMVLISTCFLSQVQSYSSATVHNDSNVSFVSSETSLIAMPKDIKVLLAYSRDTGLLDPEQQLPDILPLEVIYSNFIITNNTENIVTLDILIKSVTSGLEVDNSDNPAIFPGESYHVKFNVKPEYPAGEMVYTALIHADWENGRAEIEKKFKIDVQIPQELVIPNSETVLIPGAAGGGSSGREGLVFEKPEEVIPQNPEAEESVDSLDGVGTPPGIPEEEKPKDEEARPVQEPVFDDGTIDEPTDNALSELDMKDEVEVSEKIELQEEVSAEIEGPEQAEYQPEVPNEEARIQ